MKTKKQLSIVVESEEITIVKIEGTPYHVVKDKESDDYKLTIGNTILGLFDSIDLAVKDSERLDTYRVLQLVEVVLNNLNNK